MQSSAASRWDGPVLATLVVPGGVAIAAGLALAHWLTPRWTAGGLMHATGYPKNVEITATLAAVALGAASALLVRWSRVHRVALLLAGFGWALGLWTIGATSTPIGLSMLAAFAALAIGLDHAGAAAVAAPVATSTGERALAAALLALLSLVAAVQVVRTPPVDVFHSGEVLLTALDLLHGGRPFVTLSWPHGLADTGVAALWIALTGKIGTTPVALADVTVAGLAPLSLYLVARRVVGTPLATVTACAVALVLLVIGGAWIKGPRVGLVAIGASLCIAAAFAAATARPRPFPVVAGVALVLAHLVRIDAGLYGIPAVGAVLAYRALADPGRGVAARLGALLAQGARVAAGAALTLAVLYATLGWPDGAWRAYVFGTLPRYHSAANGMPFPWPTAAVGALSLRASEGVAALLLALVLSATALRRLARDGVARAENPRTELLLFLAVLAYLSLRTTLGRSDAMHIIQWSFLPMVGALMLVGADAAAALARRPRWAGGMLTAALAVLIGRGVLHESAPLSQLVEHLRPNPPVGACRDTTFTARELYDPAAAFLDLEGWIADPTATQPLALSLHTSSGTEDAAEASFTLPSAAAQQVPTAARTIGWSLIARLAEDRLADGVLTLRLHSGDGRWGETRLDPARACPVKCRRTSSSTRSTMYSSRCSPRGARRAARRDSSRTLGLARNRLFSARRLQGGSRPAPTTNRGAGVPPRRVRLRCRAACGPEARRHF